MRIGLVGYGTGGRYFHAPFIDAAAGITLAGIVTNSPQRRAQAEADFPGVRLYGSLGEMAADGIDAVTVTTPPETRRELVLEALGHGIHVVADKPFAPDAATGLELANAAAGAGVMLSVFHNRRWDTDVQTVKSVLDGGELGQVRRFDSRFDLDDPDTIEAGPGGGLLRDLGSHVVDQALWLFGPVTSVYASLDWVDLAAGRTDAGFVVSLNHANGVRSHISSTKANHLVSRELRVLGSAGSYVSAQTDVQAQAIFAGKRPVDDPSGWGREAEERWGTLTTAGQTRRIPSKQGAYQDFYARFAAASRGEGEQPVPAFEAIHTLEVLDAARLSDAGQRVVAVASS